MRLSEAITIYFAVGASFGVYHFLQERNSERRLPALLKAVRAMILWPEVAAKLLFSIERSVARAQADADAEPARARFVETIEDARRKLMASLYKVVELAQVSAGKEMAKAERADREVHKAVEKYIGLTLAAAEIDLDAPPSEREMALARVAGIKGDDLLLAGRCIHRRNAARLVRHQARSRTELIHALAEVREFNGHAATTTTALANPVAARHLSVATVRFYGQAFNLLTLLEDETAAASVARLLDAECGRLRRLEALSQLARESKEEEPCTLHLPHTAFNSPTQTRALNQG
jgi:hypothetical protein